MATAKKAPAKAEEKEKAIDYGLEARKAAKAKIEREAAEAAKANGAK
jgi:hypothetical protein